MRALAVVLAAGLAGCSLYDSNAELSGPVAYVPPNPPTRPALLQGLAKAAKEEGLTGELQIADLRAVDFGPGRWMICLVGLRASRPVYFAVFFENEDYKAVRLSVIGEKCEQQSYSPTGPLPAIKGDEKEVVPHGAASPAPEARRRQ
jgi:hypothetical protein